LLPGFDPWDENSEKKDSKAQKGHFLVKLAREEATVEVIKVNCG
jgi:hypothetical protein